MNELEVRIDWEVSKLRYLMKRADKMVSQVKKDDLKDMAITNVGVVNVEEFRNTLKQNFLVYEEIKNKMIVEEESPFNGSNDTDLRIDSEILDLLSPISMEDYQIVPPDVRDSTTLEFQGYSTQLEEDSQQETYPEGLIVKQEEQQLNVEFPVYPVELVAVKYESDFSELQLSSLSLPTEQQSALMLQEEDPQNPPKNSQSTYICTTSTCSLPFTSKLAIFQHNMANHIAKYFSSVQQSDIPNDQFDYYIINLLETTLDTFNKVDDKYNCDLCADQFPGWEKARNHLVVKHRPILKEKLVELQKSEIDPSQTPQQRESSISITDDTTYSTLKRKRGELEGGSRKSKSKCLKSNYNCADCSVSFPVTDKLFQHNLYNHPEKFFISVKLDFLTPHQFQNCVAHMLTTTVDQSQKVDSKYQCNFCSILISTKQSIRSHIVLKHQSVLKKKLVDLQNSSSISLIMNTSRRTYKRASFRARNKRSCDNFCKICKREFKIRLSQHQRNIHPELFFESSNLLPPSENSEKFKEIVRFVLEKEMVVPVPREGDQVKCGICLYVSSTRYSARNHLILRHRVFLANKLEDLQKSGIVIVSESDFNPGAPPFKRLKSNIHSHLVCSICEKTYKDSYILNRHQILFHPEIFFQNEKPTVLQKDSEGDELFSKYVIFMLRRQVDQEFSKITVTKGATLPERDLLEELEISVQSVRDNIKLECNFCSHALCNRQFAITHLILRHRRNMAEILGGLSGKSVEEIKLEMIPSKNESQEYNSLDSSDVCTTPTSLKRKGGWPKGKSRSMKNLSLALDCSVESGYVSPKTK